MARRRAHRERPHDLAWHEAQLAEPWKNYVDLNTGRYLSPGAYARALEGKRQQMFMHDRQPQRMRELVAEHNVNRGVQLYGEEMRASVQKCRHGRFPASCAQCTYDKAVAARARDGGEVKRNAPRTAADILRRRGEGARSDD